MRFSGIFAPLVTPLARNGQLDVEGLERLVERVLEGGVQGLFALGTTGEGQSLGRFQRNDLVNRVCSQTAGRAPVLVGVTDSSFDESLAMAEKAREAGAAALVVAPPAHFSSMQGELLDYLQAMAGACQLPLFLYHSPGSTNARIDWRTAAEASRIEGVVGYKDSSGDMIHFHRVRRATQGREDFSLLIGPEELLGEALLLGADGGVCGGANLFPGLYVELYDACRRAEYRRVRELHSQIMRISENIYELDPSSVGYIKAIKAALFRWGVCQAHLAVPFQPLGAKEASLLNDFLESWKPPPLPAEATSRDA